LINVGFAQPNSLADAEPYIANDAKADADGNADPATDANAEADRSASASQ